MLDTTEAGPISESQLQETLAAVQHTLPEIRQQGAVLSDSTLASEVEQLSEAVEDRILRWGVGLPEARAGPEQA